jgi:hypothetical protein
MKISPARQATYFPRMGFQFERGQPINDPSEAALRLAISLDLKVALGAAWLG